MCEVWISLPSTRRFEGMMLRCSFEKSINSLGSLSCHYLKNSGDPPFPSPLTAAVAAAHTHSVVYIALLRLAWSKLETQHRAFPCNWCSPGHLGEREL